MTSTIRIQNVTTMSVGDCGAAACVPGTEAAAPAAPTTGAPGTSETRALAATLGGNAIEAAMLLQLRDFQAQGRSARKEQVAARESHLAEARSAYRHHVRQAEQMRRAAAEGAVLSLASTATGTFFGGDEAGKFEKAAVGVVERLPALHEKIDRAIGHGAEASRQGLAAEAADYRSEYAAKMEEDAAGRAEDLKQSQSRVLDLLQEAMRGQSDSRAAATRA